VTYIEEERIKKVLVWRVVSFFTTLILTWGYTGSVKDASFFTIVLHVILFITHYAFEWLWDKRE